MQFTDGIYDNGELFDYPEDIRDEHEVLFSNVQSAEVGDVRFQSTFVVLKDGLVVDC